MAFTVEHFRDLIRLLEEHPEWRADLRRLVLSDEVLELPTRVRDLAETVQRLAETVQQLAQTAQQQGLQIAALAEAQRRTEVRLGRLEDQVGALRGSDLERRYREHAAAYFSGLVRRARVLTDHELAVLLDDAQDAGQVSPGERDDVLAADVVVHGRRREDGREIYLVVEASVAVDVGDVDRASRRAMALGKVHAAAPVVAGERITPDAQEHAAAAGVVLDGRPAGPVEP
jgi:hypothetical protein